MLPCFSASCGIYCVVLVISLARCPGSSSPIEIRQAAIAATGSAPAEAVRSKVDDILVLTGTHATLQ